MLVIEIYISLHTETNINSVWRNYWETIYGLIFKEKGEWATLHDVKAIYIFLISY